METNPDNKFGVVHRRRLVVSVSSHPAALAAQQAPFVMICSSVDSAGEAERGALMTGLH